MDENSVAALGVFVQNLDGQQYGAYRRIQGEWLGQDVDVCIDRVQGEGRGRGRGGGRENGDSGSGKSGKVEVNCGGAEILRRAACEVVNGELEFRIRVGLPANGRRIQGRAAMVLLSQRLPAAANAVRENCVCREKLSRWQHSTLTRELISWELKSRRLVAFVANGSILPRSSGVASQPLSGAIPFESPASLKVTFKDSDGVSIEGMGIKHGITILTGPGFHGKSTVLQALQVGCYPHIPGDGRELVITDATAVKVRSEDGRCITGVNVPGGKDTLGFSTQDASGSTSLAAAIQESLEAEASTLLLDEDTCATNLLVRDARMQELVKVDAIVPLVDRTGAAGRPVASPLHRRAHGMDWR